MIRTAGPEDAEAVAAVQIRGWQWAYRHLMPASFLAAVAANSGPWAERKRRYLTEAAAQGRQTGLVATEHGRIVGMADAGPYRIDQRDDELVETIGEIYAIYIEQDRVGTGVGRALMDAAVAWLRERSMDPVRLWVLDGNARALAFYQRYGFRPDGGRSTITLQQPGELAVELPELRLTLQNGARRSRVVG